MATIVIRDLPENVELDRQAMQAISGGARFRSRVGTVGRPVFRSTRIVKYPPAAAGGKPAQGKAPSS